MSRYYRSKISLNGGEFRTIEMLEQRALLTSLSVLPHSFVHSADGERLDVLISHDIDNDGDSDVLLTARGPGDASEIILLENADGLGTFVETESIVLGASDFVFNVFFGDTDGDGDDDLFINTDNGDLEVKFQWHENLGGERTFADATEIGEGHGHELGDFNGDGRLDVVLNGRLLLGASDHALPFEESAYVKLGGHPKMAHINSDNQIDIVRLFYDRETRESVLVWNEILGGTAVYGPDNAITIASWDVCSYGWTGCVVADVDSDGDIDVVGSQLVWFENTDGEGNFVERETGHWGEIPTLVDMDGDGDLDAFVHQQFGDATYWSKNDGQGNFPDWFLIEGDLGNSDFVEPTDVDGDGDADFVASTELGVTWFETRRTGDANDDGKVDFTDFLALSANFGATDAVWADGDFNLDGSVSFEDFLLLSQAYGSD